MNTGIKQYKLYLNKTSLNKSISTFLYFFIYLCLYLCVHTYFFIYLCVTFMFPYMQMSWGGPNL